MKNFFINKSATIIKVCFSIFIIIYSLLNILLMVYQVNNDKLVINHYLFNFNLITILQTLLLLTIYYFLTKHTKISSKKMLFIFLAVVFITSLYWAFSNHQQLLELDDAYNCFKAATKMSSGDYSPLNFKSYLNMYPHNLGMVSYFGIHLKIFKENALFSLRFSNIIFSICGYWCLYQITNTLFKNETINKIIVLLMFSTMHLVFYNFYIYANVVSYCLALISINFLLIYFQNDKFKNLLIAIITIILASITKNNSLIILIAEIIFIFIHFLKTNKKILLPSIIILIIGQYFATSGIVKFYEYRINYPFSHNSLPKIVWIATGLNYDKDHPGGYNGIIETFHYENNFDTKYTKLEAEKYIKIALKRFENPKNFFSFFTQKLAVSFANNEYDSFSQYRALPQSKLNENIISGPINWILKYFWDIVGNVISLALIIFMFNIKKMNLEQMLPATIVFGGFLFHLFWEVKTIYLYQYFMYLLPYAAFGLYQLFTKFNRFKS